MKTDRQERAEVLTANLQRSVDNYQEVLYSIAQFYQSTPAIQAKDFRSFVEPILTRYPSIRALEWLPRIQGSRRAAFEYEQGSLSGDRAFLITEKSPHGQIQAASVRQEYFPITFVEPLERNRTVLGYDLGADPTRQGILAQARDSGDIIASSRLELLQETQLGFLLVLPVYQRGSTLLSVAQRRQKLIGYVVGVFRIADLVQTALAGLDLQELDFCLYDCDSPTGDAFLAFYDSHPGTIQSSPTDEGITTINRYQEDLIWRRRLIIARREWSLVLLPRSTYVDRAVLVEKSQKTATQATAQVQQLRSLLHESQAAQALWIEQRLWITRGIGLAFGLLGCSGLLITSYLLAQYGERDPWLGTIPTLVVESTCLTLVMGFLIGVGIILKRQSHDQGNAEEKIIEVTGNLEERIQQQRAELDTTREIADLKLQFFSMASHEFRTPLTTISLSLQSLQKSPLTPKQERSINRIADAVHLMIQLLDDILTLTRAAANKLDFHPQSLDLEPFCCQILEEIDQGSRIQLMDHIPQEPLYTDPRLLHSILTNLLSNALKYSQDTVFLKIATVTKGIEFNIEDQGIGIPMASQPYIFEPFHRADNTQTHSGSGLGLAVVKSCIDRLGGTVRFRSAENKGTTFWVHLPDHPTHLEQEIGTQE